MKKLYCDSKLITQVLPSQNLQIPQYFFHLSFTIIVETQGLRKFIRKNFQKFGYLKLVIIDNLSQISNKNFFSIIIGSGPAGLTLALELEKKKNN